MLAGIEDAKMNRFIRSLLGLAIAVAVGGPLGGCYAEGDDIDRVQTNLVAKSMFEGDWWYGQTIVDVDSDEGVVTWGGSFEGAMAFGDLGLEPRSGFTRAQTSLSMPRIRWVLDEDFLIAYRAYELIIGGNDDARDEDFRGQPLAVFAIEGHVDVRREYNPITGELTNVTVENTSDRRWFEREFVRVDWSRNLISSFYDAINTGLSGIGLRREPAPFDIEPGSEFENIPDSLRPQFVRVGEDPDYRFRDEWPAGSEDTVHYFSIVNNEMISPGNACVFFGATCATAVVSIRHAFLRVPPEHEYAAETQTHDEFDKFGTFRTYQRTFVRGGADEDTLEAYCASDADCGTGGSCDLERNICDGGLTESYGETDFLAFFRPRHNTWANALSDVECLADYQCDGRFGTEGALGPQSKCDLAARRCTNPFVGADGTTWEDGCTDCRQPRKVAYKLSKHFPPHLVETAFHVVGDWNEVFMQGTRASLGKAPMSAAGADGVPGTADDVFLQCQDDNPTGYCFCGGVDDVGDGTCPYRYDPFTSPEEATALGVANPYDCYVQAPEGYEAPARPSSYDEYPTDVVYGYEFVGDECAFILESNSCDLDPSQPCEELGDIRYQFFNYIDHAFTRFGGIALPLVDPTSGELITANANMAGTSVENMVTRAVEYFPFLRGEQDPDWYVEGENLRRYFDGLGRTERPEGVSFLGSSGVETGDGDRPENIDRLALINLSLERSRERFERFQGDEGRFNSRQDRLLRLKGTGLEERFLQAAGQDLLYNVVDPDLGMLADQVTDPDEVQKLLRDETIRDQISPFREGFLDRVQKGDEQERFLNSIGHDPVMIPDITSQYWEYYADRFAGRPPAEAAIRMQQRLLYGVMTHEVGHSVGLRHNFGATYDRDNYADGYFFQVTNDTLRDESDDLPLPNITDFDEPGPPGVACEDVPITEPCGNLNGVPDGEEVVRYKAALTAVRDERARRGLSLVMNSSVMDYHGDLGLMSGLGRYDRAATLWNHYDRVEAFTACTACEGNSPLRVSQDTLDEVTYSHVAPRQLFPYYRGGESCSVDPEGVATGCPYADPASTGAPWFQRCISNPRNEVRSVQDIVDVEGEPCAVGEANCVCSSSEIDGRAYAKGDPAYERVGYYLPVEYLFCTDDRLSDLSWCSVFDAGESFLETIDHFRRSWYDNYPNRYYRRFRRTNFLGRGAIRPLTDAAKIYQHFLFRYFYEPGFRSDEGPLGILDQLDASSMALNFMAEIITLPDQGIYELDEDDNVWRRTGEDFRADVPEGGLSLGPGVGFPMWTSYQDSYQGFFRTERAGLFFDKFFALYAIALRDWNLTFGIDELFYLNFYDFYRYDVTELYAGVISQEPRMFAPRMRVGEDGQPVITPLPFARRGGFRRCVDEAGVEGGITEPCGEPLSDAFPGAAIENTTNNLLRDWASVLALAQFPDYTDPTFERQLLVSKLGSGEQFTLPDSMKRDGSPGCAFGDVTLNPIHVTGCEDPDYVVFTSNALNQSYVAVKVRSREQARFPSRTASFEQVGFNLLADLVVEQDELEQKEAELAALTPGTPAWQALRDEVSDLRRDVTSRTSYLDYLIEVQDRFGISSFFF